MRHRSSLFITLAAIAIVVGLVALIATQHNSLSPTGVTGGQTGQPANPSQFGSISATLISPDNQVRLRVVGIERESTRWLFHIHAQNAQQRQVTILSNNHYFMLSGHGTPGTPVTASQIFRKLVSPTQAGLAQSDLTSHPALAPVVKGLGTADGWLVADLTNYAYTPDGLLYVYGTVPSKMCVNPQQPNTCHPDVGYQTLIWDLP